MKIPETAEHELRSAVEEARAEALAELRTRLRDAMVAAWWPAALELAGLGSGVAEADEPVRVDDGRELVYVYGFALSSAPPPVQVTAIEPGAAIERVAVGDVCALSSRVPAATYDEAGLRVGFADDEWLAARVRAHDAVLRSAAELGPIIPLRLCAIYRDEHRVRAVVGQNHAAITSELRRLDGHREWGVKVHVELDQLEPAGDRAKDLADLRAELEAATPGRARFVRRRLEAVESQLRLDAAERIARDLHLRLAEESAEAVRLAVQPSSVTGRSRPQILHAAYLVAVGAQSRFEEALTRWSGREGVEPLLTGPWPPFHFSRVQLQEPEEAHG